MDPKRRRTIWLGAGLAFALAVGSGYIPDLMLAREEAAARSEGLIVAQQTPAPKEQDARLAYEAVRKKHPGLVQALRAGSVSRQIDRMVLSFVEASKRPVFRPPAPERLSVATPGAIPMASPARAYAYQTLVPDLRTVAEALAKAAATEETLRGAARIAAHLQNEDPELIPSSNWSDLATMVLDGADQGHYPAEARARVVADLAPPDPIALLRRRAASLLAASSETRSSVQKRQRIRFIRFWRDFLKTAPREPQAFARRVAEEEDRIVAVDEGMDAGTVIHIAPSSTKKPWAAWAAGMAKALDRINQEPRP